MQHNLQAITVVFNWHIEPSLCITKHTNKSRSLSFSIHLPSVLFLAFCLYTQIRIVAAHYQFCLAHPLAPHTVNCLTKRNHDVDAGIGIYHMAHSIAASHVLELQMSCLLCFPTAQVLRNVRSADIKTWCGQEASRPDGACCCYLQGISLTSSAATAGQYSLPDSRS